MMMTELKKLYVGSLRLTAGCRKLGIGLMRVAIFVIFVWIGGLKFWNYEAEGIVPFVANSPFMSFFYTKSAPEYRDYKLREGEFDPAKRDWHTANNTYGFSRGLGVLIMGIGVLAFLGMFFPKAGLVGAISAAERGGEAGRQRYRDFGRGGDPALRIGQKAIERTKKQRR